VPGAEASNLLTGFRDPELASANLAKISGRAPSVVVRTLRNLLAESPDPDAALNLFERLCDNSSAEVLRQMERHPFLVHYAVLVFGYSQYLGETLIQNTDLFAALARERMLDRTHSRDDFRESFARFRSRSFETDVSLLLARFKRREYIRIMIRDVLAIATLAETTGEISALSDVLIEEALRATDMALRNRYGASQRADEHGRGLDVPFAVLSLGKLGGNELNYNSDVDLLYVYGDGERPSPAEISNREYFIRLAQQVTDVLSRPTQEGAVFRIDLRLRPQGHEGEPAISLRHALHYYAAVAHDWEMQALIKARHSAGDLPLARAFIRGVQPFVYKEQLNFSAIETAIAARRKMTERRSRAVTQVSTTDVKVDTGGIRDIEFLVQCLQRVYGGKEPWLRSGGTLFSLQKLHDKGHISGKDFHELTLAYSFLRKVEHRLQLRRGQQTHRLPGSPEELRALSKAVGDDEARQPERRGIAEEVAAGMAAVAQIYQRIVHSQQMEQHDEFRLTTGSEFGSDQTLTQVLERLAVDAPKVHRVAVQGAAQPEVRRNLQRFLSSASTSSDRYAELLRSPQALERALSLFAASEHLTEILVRHPDEIESLAHINSDPSWFPPGLFAGEPVAHGHAYHDTTFAYIGSAELPAGEKLALLRRHYRHRLFVAGARDLMERRSVQASLRELTLAADDASRAAVEIAEPPPGFALLALGRLGTREFDIASDADLLFVRSEQTDKIAAIEAAQRIVQALAAYTREGTLFAVDPRLRPQGGAGELVFTPEQLGVYFANEAKAWEALSYTKLRCVAGDTTLGTSAVRAVRKCFRRFAADAGFTVEVRAMRDRLAESVKKERNFKLDALNRR
jgi:glutamate-ammonia-ligase adenylyltransferase